MKNKTMNKWQWASALVTMALFTACQQDMTEDVLTPEASKQMNVIVTAQQGEGVDSRVSYTPQEEDDGTSVVVRWEGKPEEMLTYTYYDNNGTGVHLGILPSIESTVSTDGKSQQFGGELNLNDGVNAAWHHVFYPVPSNSWVTKNEIDKTLTIRYPMNNQVQDCTLGNETKHLEAYNIMSVLDNTIETGNAIVRMEHQTSLLYMDLTLPEANTINSLKLVADNAMFSTEFKMVFSLNNSTLEFSTDNDKMATNMTLTLQNDAEDTSVKGYLMLTPYFIKANQSVTFHIEATATDATYKSEDITVSTKGYLFKAGQCKTLKRTLTKVVPIMGDKTATQAVKGDYAMADGTFISKDATLTDEQKANVRGIVFWTTANMNPNPNAQTPARLVDDAIMVKDFPKCNHGLIVSLKDVGQTMWQDYPTEIAYWQSSDAFNADDKSDYKSIASYVDEDAPINYILGYQNTKILKAYNASLASGSDNTVLPVSLLETFSTDNPAPANTTGWFIPSVKELTLLYGVDADNVYGSNTYAEGSVTKTLINGILSSWSSDANVLVDFYWSSSAFEDETLAFGVVFSDYDVFPFDKNANGIYVRAVCAY